MYKAQMACCVCLDMSRQQSLHVVPARGAVYERSGRKHRHGLCCSFLLCTQLTPFFDLLALPCRVSCPTSVSSGLLATQHCSWRRLCGHCWWSVQQGVGGCG
jgi:hypothetical protein